MDRSISETMCGGMCMPGHRRSAVDVCFEAFNDGVYGDGSIVNIQIKPLGIVEIVDA